ncbi:MAG TPA: zinc ribbon domain-containing protein, partial [Pyrinomonadaceae bacterium]
MFCPKCGTQNPETGKFCRACGTDLGNITSALSGNLPPPQPPQPAFYVDHRGRVKSNDPTDIWSQAVRSMIMGLGFLVVSIVLLITNVANGNKWWWAMLFPAFSMLAVGASQMARVKRMEKQKTGGAAFTEQAQFAPHQANLNLPPPQTDYVKPPQ